ncbi:MAG: YdbL family protein [Magnetospiraceae bacterium]
MKQFFRIAFVALAMLSIGVGGPAFADALDSAKKAGQVGEQSDGYLGVVSGGTPGNVRSLVQDINMKRREKYREIAASRGIGVTAFEAIMGEKLVNRAPKGEYVRLPNGKWKKK